MASGFLINGWMDGRAASGASETSIDVFYFWHIETAFWGSLFCGADLRPNEHFSRSKMLHIFPSHMLQGGSTPCGVYSQMTNNAMFISRNERTGDARQRPRVCLPP